MKPNVKEDVGNFDGNFDCDIEPGVLHDLVRQALVYSLTDPNADVRRDAQKGLRQLCVRQLLGQTGSMMSNNN